MVQTATRRSAGRLQNIRQLNFSREMTEKENAEDNSKPPVFRNWKRMYLFVLLNLALTIVIFYLITLYFK
jgi:hypothetical protein